MATDLCCGYLKPGCFAIGYLSVLYYAIYGGFNIHRHSVANADLNSRYYGADKGNSLSYKNYQIAKTLIDVFIGVDLAFKAVCILCNLILLYGLCQDKPDALHCYMYFNAVYAILITIGLFRYTTSYVITIERLVYDIIEIAKSIYIYYVIKERHAMMQRELGGLT